MAWSIDVDLQETHATLFPVGQVDMKSAPDLLDKLRQVGLADLPGLRIVALDLTFLSSAGLRALVFARPRMPHSTRLILVGGSPKINATVMRTRLANAVTFVERIEAIGEYDASRGVIPWSAVLSCPYLHGVLG